MILIQNAHIKPIVGPELPNGCLLAEDGRITACLLYTSRCV